MRIDIRNINLQSNRIARIDLLKNNSVTSKLRAPWNKKQTRKEHKPFSISLTMILRSFVTESFPVK